MSSKTLVILGAGPTGMSLAYTVLKNKTHKVIILEKEATVGGGSTSFKWKDHMLDYGPHAFHRRGGEPEKLIRGLFCDDQENLIEGKKNVFVLLKNKFFRYPLEISESLMKFNLFLTIRIIIEFIFTFAIHSLISFPLENFEMWGKKKFGPKLYMISFGYYSQKVWKTSTSKISHKFASEKIQGFDFINLIKRLFKIGGQVTEPYFQSWLYPSNGSGEIYKRLQNKIMFEGGEVILQAKILEVKYVDNDIKTIKYQKNNKVYDLSADIVVNTIHLPEFVSLIKNDLPFFIKYTSKKLKYISQVLVYLELDTKEFSKMHWFYLLDPKYNFNRITEQKHLSSKTINSDKTVLCLELTCHFQDETWNADNDKIISLAKEELSKLPIKDIPDIVDAKIVKIKDVYELYYKNFDENVASTMSYILSLNKIYSVGRKGMFLQGDQHQSIATGIEFAKILANKKIMPMNIRQYYYKHMKFLDNGSLV